MYYHPLASAESEPAEPLDDLAAVALDSWARQQKQHLEAIEQILADPLLVLPPVRSDPEPRGFAFNCFALCAPAGFLCVQLVARSMQWQIEAYCRFIAALHNGMADRTEHLESARPLDARGGNAMKSSCEIPPVDRPLRKAA